MKNYILFIIVLLFSIDVFAQNTLHVKAQDYVSVSNEIHNDNYGICIGWITNGSYAYYGQIDFGANITLFRASVATPSSGSSIEVRLDSPTGLMVGKLAVPNNGDWANFKTYETQLMAINGKHQLYLVFTGGDGQYLLNLSWFEFERSKNNSPSNNGPTNNSPNSANRIQAENFVNVSSGIQKYDINPQIGSVGIGWIGSGAYAYYGNYDFGAGCSKFAASVASGSYGGTIELKLDSKDGSTLAKIVVESTGDWNKYETKAVQLPQVSGKHDVYLVFSGGSGYLMNLDWIEFQSSANPSNSNINSKGQAKSAENGIEIFNNWNKSTVSNGAKANCYFYLSQKTAIIRISNYHWNNGQGAYPGQIGIKNSSGNILGMWQSVGTSGTGGANNVNWIVSPNITLEPGLYEIIDGEPSTWSQNYGSFGAGFSAIFGK